MRNFAAAVDIIKRWEGILDGNPNTANLEPYLCPAGVWTIGWGHTVVNAKGQQLRGKPKKAEALSIYPQGINMVEAMNLLTDDVRKFAAGVERLVKVELTNNQFCALVSFSFNVGINAFATSTLLRRVNAGNFEDVPAQLSRWTKIDGKESEGLARRRQDEARLWTSK